MSSLNTLIKIVACVCFLGASVWVSGQNKALDKGTKYYNEQAYPLAIRFLNKGLKKLEDGNARANLASSLEEIGDYAGSLAEWKKLAEGTGAKPIWHFHYGRLLKMNGKYVLAADYFEKYRQSGENNVLALKYKQSCDFAQELMADSLRYKITKEGFSGKSSDFGPFITRTGLVFASTRPRGFCARVLNLRNNDYFYDLYAADRSTKGKTGWEVKALKGKVNSRFHEGPAVMNNDGSILYFTRSNFVGGKKGENKAGVTTLKIYQAKRVGKKWKEVEVLPFCSDEYSTGHPALSADGLTMYFSSNRPGGFGKSDIYRVTKEGNGWSEPENLGPVVNSFDDEVFPVVATDGSLLFSSDGHTGMGGMDIFVVAPSGNRWGEVRNAGYPLNGPTDDFSITLVKGKAKGYFSSDRPGGEGKDDIYAFERKMVVNGTVADSKTGNAIPGATVKMDDGTGVIATVTADGQGRFKIPADYGKDYLILADANEYIQGKQRLEASKTSPLSDPEMRLELERDLHFEIAGTITDATTQQGLPNSQIRLKKTSGSSKIAYSQSNGTYEDPLDLETEYTVFLMKKGYVPAIRTVSTEGKKETQLFRENAALQPGKFILVEGEVVQKEAQTPIAGATVHSIDIVNRKEIAMTKTNRAGQFNLVLDPAVEQILLISSQNQYFTARYEVPKLGQETADTTVYPRIELVPWEVGQLVKIIYYDYNKSAITQIAVKDLFEIVYFLKDNPEASVELGSHTDSRGSDVYNKDLSQERSDAAVQFIVSQGVQANRIAAKGYGESMLTNDCKDGVECSDEAHGKNRRTEIRITKIDQSLPKESIPGSLLIDKSKIKFLNGK